MQYSEDDMNDLFRKAAEEYSPTKGESNWQNISDRITDHQNNKAFAPAKKTSISRKFIALVFLFISVTGGWIIFKNGSFEKTILSAKVNKTTAIESHTATPDLNENKTEPTLTDPKQTKRARSYRQTKSQNDLPVPSRLLIKGFAGNPGLINKYTPANQENNINPVNDVNQKEQLPEIQFSLQENNEIKTIDTSAGYPDKIRGDDYLNKNIKPVEENKINKGNINILDKQRGAYVGFAVAVDFSNVKSSSVSSAGYAWGFLAGYKFNKKVSLETGLLFNRRNYNSEGKYFEMDKIKPLMPAGMQIKSLYSNSAVIELPFKIKYQLASFAKSNIFISGGMSAYLITSQKNHYQASLNGNDEQFSGMYRKNDLLLPAALNMSIGYEHAISEFLNIRAEPFLKTPLKGMGIGNLPVTSAGVQVALTRRLK